MKSRKIWSIPIAALAFMLMLAGALAVSSVVQAQTLTPSFKNGDIIKAFDGDSKLVDKLVVKIETENLDGAKIVPEVDENLTKTPPDVEFINPAIIGGPTVDKGDKSVPMFIVNGDEKDVTVNFSPDVTADNVQAGSYTFQVQLVLDEDTAIDADSDGKKDNDRDITLTANVTVNVMKVAKNDLQFDVVPAKAVAGAVVSGLGNPIATNPLQWEIDGIGASAKLVGIEKDGIVNTDFQIKEFPAGSGKFRLFVVNSGASSLTGDKDIKVNLTYDEDTSVASAADNDAVKDNDKDVVIALKGDLNVQKALAFTGTLGEGPDGKPSGAPSDGIHYMFTIPQATAEDVPFGAFDVDGAITNDKGVVVEYIDGILSGADSSPFGVNDTDMSIYRKNDSDLEVRDYVFDLSVNGDAGLASRAIRGKVKVVVTASNQGHTAPATFTPLPIKENDDETGVLVKAGAAVGDASVGVVNTDGDTLTYKPSGAGANRFKIDGKTGVITVKTGGIADTTGPTAPATKYTRIDGGELVNDTDEFSNIVYKFDIEVSDGTVANDVTIKAKVTVDVNDPVSAKTAADLPSEPYAVMAGLIDHDGDAKTDMVPGYEVAVTVAERDVPVVLFNLNDLVSDADPEDYPLDYDDAPGANNPSHIVLSAAGDVTLTYLPPDPNKGLTNLTNVVTVTADDGYNNTAADVTLYIEVTVTETPAPPITSKFVDITVAENSLVCSQVGVASGCSLAGLVDTADSFSIESGVDGGKTDYAIDITTGAITVVTAPNYEDSKSPAFFVNVKDDLGDLAALVSVRVTVTDVNEAPKFADDAPAMATIAEEGKADRPAMDADGVALVLAATDEDAADTGAVYSIAPATAPFAISVSGAVTEAGELEAGDSYILTITATDRRDPALTDTREVTISVGDINEAPYFTEPSGEDLTIDVPENVDRTAPIVTFEAMDPDANDTLKFSIRDEADKTFFSIDEESGELTLVKDLDYETKTELEAHVVVTDAAGLSDRVKLIVNVGNENDEPPVIGNRNGVLSVNENAARGTILGDYSATDLDGDAITYSLSGADAKSFRIPAGVLMTLEALDADSNTPCGLTGCHVKVVANDTMHTDSVDVTITVINVEDSVSTFDISKANPVPGVTMGDAMSALGDAKESMYGVPESPADLPATDGDGPDNFVDTQWANWGSVLRIAVTSQSPDANCGNGNQCVKVIVASDSADETIVLEAYRSAEKDNLFIAAVMPVSGEVVNGDYSMESSVDAYNRMNPGATSVPSMYKQHGGAGVARLEVDEEDEITIEFGNLRGTIDVENENPEFSNFAPEHESAFDDGDVDYTFTITDPVSGIPDPEDLPDIDGDGDYMPVVAIISGSQCHTEPSAKYTVQMYAGNSIWCASMPEIREIVDDRDFDEIDDGFEVETKIVLPENRARYVTFIACDAAGNCAMYTPDENETEEALAKITIDTEKPELVEARTGIKWDATDSEYDDDRSFIQVLFEDLTALNPDTIETDDFVVEGHTIKDVHWYDVSDGDDDTAWGDDDKGTTPSRFAMGGQNNKRNHPLRQSIRNAVFIELEDELAADETPDVTVVPNGIEDSAGNEQDDGDKEADDWIAPSFTVVSIVSPGTPEGSSNVLAGDGDEVVVTLTADERIQQTRPKIDVTYVNAPAGCVNTGNRTDNNPYDRGEIKTGGDCGGSATGGTLGTTIEKVSNTEWVITIDEPGDTGYYNFYVYANDRSAQANKGSEGIAPTSIVGDFFERDGDVNSGDAHYFQGDINLGNPGVRVSGVQIEDTEPTVEFKTPLFVELDFTRPYTATCDADDDDDRDANCLAESDEYAKDSFDSVTVTSFVLNGVDMTDSVKTTDNETFLVSIDGIGIGDHEIEVQAMDQAGNTLDKSLSIEFEVEERDPFSRRLNPGWNLVSLPGEPADSDISVVFGSNVEVRTVYTYDPIIPGGWMVAVRETLDSDWQGDLMDITARRGYWVLSDAIQDWEVSIPRLAGGAVGSGTPIQPPVIGLYAGWNLIPVVDVRGGALDDGKSISATAYLNSLDDGLDLARVLGFNTITNTWTTVLDPDDTSADAGELRIGSGYWVFVREAASLVPGGIAQ